MVASSPFEERLLRPPEVARILRRSTRTVQTQLRLGLLPGVRDGKLWFVPEDRLNAYLRALVAKAEQNVRERS